MIGQYQRLTLHAMENCAFSAERTIEVLQVSSASKTTCDETDILEGAAVSLMSKYLTGALSANFTRTMSWAPPASEGEVPRALRTIRVRGFSSYPKAVQHLLKSFATEEVIVAEFDGLKNLASRTSGQFVRDTARICNNVSPKISSSSISSSAHMRI